MTNPKSVKFFRPLFYALLPTIMWAQSYEISGTVRNSEGANVSFANVVLLKVSDTTLIKGASADENGRFILSEISPDLYYLQARYFGYRSSLIPLDIKQDITIGAVFMEPENVWLDEVVVTASHPTLERKEDRLVFNVENSTVSQGNTWDILRNTPGVINVQNQLQIRGQPATIYLNDRRVQLSQSEVKNLLESLAGSSISSVEVISNPPARYDSEGGPVLNIITNKNVVPGYKGSVQGVYTQSVFAKYLLGTSHYFKNNKFNIFGNYTINPRKDFRGVPSDINFINDQDEFFARWETQYDRITRSQAQQANLIVDYDLDEKNRFNLTTNLSYSPNRTRDIDLFTEMQDAQNVLDSTLNTESLVTDDNLNLGMDLNYERVLNDKGASLKVNGHYTYYELEQDQVGSTDYFDPAGNFIRNFRFSTDARQETDIITGQADLSFPVGEARLDTGAKISNVKTDSRIDYFDVNGNEPPFDIVLSDIFSYKENVWAIYAGYTRNWKKWSLKLGLRGEQTNIKTASITLDSIGRQDYFELFPTVFLLHRIDDQHSISFDYNRRIRRPNYRYLNPFRFFLNENDFREGNPNLIPHFSHNFNVNYSFKDTYFFDVYYRDNGNYINRLTFQDNVNQVLRQSPQNSLESTSYGIDLTMSKTFNPVWYFYAYASIFHEDDTFLALASEEETYKNEIDGFYGYIANYLTLTKDKTLTGEVSFTYFTGFISGSYKLDESLNLNLGLQKSLWQQRATVAIRAEDLLGRVNSLYTSRYYNQDNSYLPMPETQFVRVSFTYNFGNYKLSDNKRSLKKSERDRLDNE